MVVGWFFGFSPRTHPIDQAGLSAVIKGVYHHAQSHTCVLVFFFNVYLYSRASTPCWNDRWPLGYLTWVLGNLSPL